MNMLLQIEGLTKAYGPVAVLRGVSMTLAHGQSLALTGESGSGKSQSMLAKLERFYERSVRAVARENSKCAGAHKIGGS